MPGFPAPFIRFREDDPNGFPLAGGKLYSYAAGTSTPLATYTTQALTVPNANPVVLDASGRAAVFMQDGVGYKFVLTDALGNQIWTEDNVQVPQILAPAAPAEVPAGGIVAYGGATAPSGWVLCDGRSLSTAPPYDKLFAAILYTFGGAGAQFNVPDLRGRFPLGKAVNGTGASLGEAGGQIDHVHTGGAHTHGIATHSHDLPAHTHPVPYNGWSAQMNTAAVQGVLQVGLSSGVNLMQATGNNTTGSSAPASTGEKVLTTDTGGAVPSASANPPFLSLNFIIKA